MIYTYILNRGSAGICRSACLCVARRQAGQDVSPLKEACHADRNCQILLLKDQPKQW